MSFRSVNQNEEGCYGTATPSRGKCLSVISVVFAIYEFNCLVRYTTCSCRDLIKDLSRSRAARIFLFLMVQRDYSIALRRTMTERAKKGTDSGKLAGLFLRLQMRLCELALTILSQFLQNLNLKHVVKCSENNSQVWNGCNNPLFEARTCSDPI